MRLLILDENFETLGAIGVFNTLMWTPRYYEVGSFELHMSADYFPLINEGRYLYRNDSDLLGVIREVNFAKDENGARTAYCKGYFAESLLDTRVVEVQRYYAAKLETVCRAMVIDHFLNPSDVRRKVTNMQLGAPKDLGDYVSVTVTGDNVGEKLYKVEKTQEMSHRVKYDYEKNKLTFEVWKGKDRTDSQTENSWAIFADSFFNIKNAQYDRDSSNYKNFAYVAGEGEGKDRKIVTIDLSAGEERRELYVDARDLQSTYQNSAGEDIQRSDAEYEEMLRQRGLEKLAEYQLLEVVNSSVDPDANLVYGVDFDLGDLCTYRYTDVGIECTKRITEVQEVFEGGKHTLNVTFGSSEVTSIKKLIERETT